MTAEKPKKTLSFDPERCNDLYEALVEVFQEHKPTVGEIIIAYGNLGYTLGASIGGYPDKGPSIEALEKLYYEKPGDLAIALMMQGLTVTTWYRDWEQIQTAQDTNKEG
jgi:hypothetical protein